MALPGGMQRYPMQLQIRQSDPRGFGAHEQHRSLDGSCRFTLLQFYSLRPAVANVGSQSIPTCLLRAPSITDNLAFL
jgi:hypothetical protein